MNSELYTKIANSTAHRASRDENAEHILANIYLLPDLFEIALHVGDKNHHKACWILELVLEKDLFLLEKYLDVFCNSMSKYTNQSAMRSISKISMFLSQNGTLTPFQEQKITENCLDWIINDTTKTATKAYAIRSLYALSTKNHSILVDLKRILIDDYPKNSSAYKAVAREILKKIK